MEKHEEKENQSDSLLFGMSPGNEELLIGNLESGVMEEPLPIKKAPAQKKFREGLRSVITKISLGDHPTLSDNQETRKSQGCPKENQGARLGSGGNINLDLSGSITQE